MEIKALFRRGEILFSDSAKRAYPILGEVFEGCSGSDSVFRIAGCGVIFVSADIASVLFHDSVDLNWYQVFTGLYFGTSDFITVQDSR